MMWLATAVPIVLFYTLLINLYLKRQVLCGAASFKEKLSELMPKNTGYGYFIYQAVSIIAALTVYYLSYKHSGHLKAIKLMTLFMLLVPAAYIDFKGKIIPNVIILSGLALRVVLYATELIFDNAGILNTFASDLTGLLFGGGLFLACALISKESVGMGDVKLLGMAGLYLGFRGIFSVVFFALLISLVFAIVLLIAGKKNKKDALPLAPFIFAAVILVGVLGGY